MNDTLSELETPALIVDRGRFAANVERMRAHVGSLGCRLRPHVKTAKSIDAIRMVLDAGPRSITVSTLLEAEYFLGHGVTDITYAVGLAPNKVEHVIQLHLRGAALAVLIDSVGIIATLAAAARAAAVTVPVYLEVDVDGHRAGLDPRSSALLTTAAAVAGAAGLQLRGVLTHAGGSYACRGADALVEMAERERQGAILAATRIRAAGLSLPMVSIGSTPSVLFSRNLNGVSEVRAGVYMFQDLVMAGLGVCALDDIALSVLVSVIGHKAERGWIITDGGWMSLSRDTGTAAQPLDQGYGVVCGLDGRVLADDLIVRSTNQEHGIIAQRAGKPFEIAAYPVGMLLRVLPNHACATAAQHARFHVVDDSQRIDAIWNRFSGW